METSELIALGEHILTGHVITYDEAKQLTDISNADILLLTAYANKIRQHYAGNKVDLCGIRSWCGNRSRYCHRTWLSTDS